MLKLLNALVFTARSTVQATLNDLLYTAAYPRLTDKIAMKIGSKYKFSEVQTRHWGQFTEAAGLSPCGGEEADSGDCRPAADLCAYHAGGDGAAREWDAVLGEIVGLVE